MDLFGVTPDMIRAKRNPGNDTNMFQVGESSGQCPSALVTEKISDFDEYVASRQPEKYRRLLTRSQGEILVEYAVAAQPTATLALFPVVTGSLVLYRNYFNRTRRDYALRTRLDAMDPSEYSVAVDTGVVTFSPPLAAGDQILADYRHTACSKIRYLRKIVVTLVAADLMEEFPAMGDTAARVDELRKQAYGDLDRLRNGQSGLQIFDDIPYVDELETRNGDGSISLGLAGGLL